MHLPMLRALAWKNVRLRYKSSFFGFAWSLLNPLLFLLIFLLIFREAFPTVPNYPVFALAGLIFWTCFATMSGHMAQALVDNAGVLRTLPVPPLVFPFAQALASAMNLMFSLVPLLLLLLWFGWRPAPVHLLALPIIVLFLVFVTGIGTVLCATNIYFRDVGLLWSALLPALFYLTPIAYPPELIPADTRWVFGLNPIYHYIGCLRAVLVDGVIPGMWSWLLAFILAAGSLLFGLFVHSRMRAGYVAAC